MTSVKPSKMASDDEINEINSDNENSDTETQFEARNTNPEYDDGGNVSRRRKKRIERKYGRSNSRIHYFLISKSVTLITG